MRVLLHLHLRSTYSHPKRHNRCRHTTHLHLPFHSPKFPTPSYLSRIPWKPIRSRLQSHSSLDWIWCHSLGYSQRHPVCSTPVPSSRFEAYHRNHWKMPRAQNWKSWSAESVRAANLASLCGWLNVWLCRSHLWPFCRDHQRQSPVGYGVQGLNLNGVTSE